MRTRRGRPALLRDFYRVGQNHGARARSLRARRLESPPLPPAFWRRCIIEPCSVQRSTVQYAVIDGARREPTPNLAGATCPVCGATAIAKCGPKIVWHWAHAGKRHCDSWWENETPWHREWKSYFPEAEREVVHFDGKGEKHIADVKTAHGMVIEFQNSAMPIDELRARETFYGRMFWIVNGADFAARFHFLSALPDPKSAFAKDLVFQEQRVEWLGRAFWRKSENPQHTDPNAMVRVHSIREIDDEIAAHHVGHFLFDWKRPRDVWYAAAAPVFFDFGGDVLWRLGMYDDRGLRCVRRVQKRDLVEKNGGTYRDAPL